MHGYSFFQRDKLPDEFIERLVERDETDFFKRIRCPLCQWQPQKSDLWTCGDCAFPEYFYGGCYTDWNTFDTRGVCPGCQHQWRWTSCLSCWQWSLHEDWYESEESDDGG